MVYLEGMNDKSFEDHKKMEELKYFSFNTLYPWTVVYISPLVLSFHDFLVIVFSCILLVYLRVP
jgi:hypothetical protein